MLSIIAYINKFFNQSSPAFSQNEYSRELEQYIVSRNPSSIAEIEHLTRQFDRTLSNKVWPL